MALKVLQHSRFRPEKWARLLLLIAIATGVKSSRAADRNPEPQPDLHGRLRTFEGLPVLELWGARTEMAFAHGYLMAERIAPLFDDFILSPRMMPELAAYQAIILPSMRTRWDWTEYEPELQALAEGVRAKLGPRGLWSKRLNRALTVDDLMACNALPDWHGLFCSSFSAWGEFTADGNTLTARNLDYDSTPEMARAQFILLQRGAAHRRGWIAITWPGLLGVYTGTNAEGVSVLSHDANSLPKSYVSGFTPRGLIFREVLEAAGATTAFEDAARVFTARRVVCGNNQHVSIPMCPGGSPARIFEYDSNSEGQGITVRAAGTEDHALIDALYCTNHVRMRQTPAPCDRYAVLDRELHDARFQGQKLDWRRALEIARKAAQNDTLHTIVVEPNRGLLHVLIPSLRDTPVTVDYAAWFREASAGAAQVAP